MQNLPSSSCFKFGKILFKKLETRRYYHLWIWIHFFLIKTNSQIMSIKNYSFLTFWYYVVHSKREALCIFWFLDVFFNRSGKHVMICTEWVKCCRTARTGICDVDLWSMRIMMYGHFRLVRSTCTHRTADYFWTTASVGWQFSTLVAPIGGCICF